MRKKYKHIFFDLDNTLWDFERNAFDSLHEIYHTYRLNFFFNNFEQFHNLYFQHNKLLWELYPQGLITRKQLNLERFLYPLSQVGHPDEELALRLSDDYLKISPTKTNVMPHAIETLEYLAPKYTMHIISNGFTKMQKIKIELCGFSSYITNMFLSESVGYHKPDKRIFEYAIKSSNARKTESIMIGDNFQADITGAKNFGIDQVYYPAYHEETTLPFTPTYTIASLLELKSFL